MTYGETAGSYAHLEHRVGSCAAIATKADPRSYRTMLANLQEIIPREIPKGICLEAILDGKPTAALAARHRKETETVFIPVAPPTASPTALDLGTRLQRAIEEYRQLHPDLSPHDIYMALQIAGRSTGARNFRPGVLLVLGALFAGWIAIVLVKDKGGAAGAEALPFIVTVIAAIVILLAVVLIIRRQ